MRLTVVIPTYNEAENLPKMVSALFHLPVPSLQILIVDDNSPDGTGSLAEKLGQENPGRIGVIHRPGKLGLGSAYLQGFQHALADGAEGILQMDCDFSHPVETIPELIGAAEQGFDMVVGSRYVEGGALDENWPFWRKALSGFGNFYARTILGLPFRDVTGGFRLWRRETLEKLPLESIRSNGYVFQVEMAYVAYRMGFKFTEIPIYFADRRWGKSKMSIRIQLEAAVRVWQLKWMYRNLSGSSL